MKIKTRRYYIYYFAKIGVFLLGIIPLNVSLFISECMGKVAFRILKKYRNITIENLNNVFGKNPNFNVQKTAEKVFINLAKNGAEWIKFPGLNEKNISDLVKEFSGEEHLKEANRNGKGTIIMAFHFGNWELLNLYLTIKGYGGIVIARRLYFHKYDKMIARIRKRPGINLIYRDESPKKILKHLKDGGILGVLADQDVDSVEGIYVDFFGKSAYTPVAPVKLGLTTGASLLPCFVVRDTDNKFKIIVEKPIILNRTENKEEDIKKYTVSWTRVLEEYVKKYPDQWVWVHKRWKTQNIET